MSGIPDLPPWGAVIVAVLVLGGSTFTLIGAIGLLRFGTFYERVHAPTIGSSFGVAGISLASIVCFSILRSGLVVAAALAFVLLTLTMPVGLALLARAALFRDRAEGSAHVPPLEATTSIGDG